MLALRVPKETKGVLVRFLVGDQTTGKCFY